LLVADRLDRLSDAARDFLVVCAAVAHPTTDVVTSALAEPARAGRSLTEVVELGVMEIDGQPPAVCASAGGIGRVCRRRS